MATKRKTSARSPAAAAVQQMLANPEVLHRLMAGGQEFFSSIAERWTESRALRRGSHGSGGFTNPFGAERLQRRLANAGTTVDEVVVALGGTRSPGLHELQDQIARLTLSLKAAEGFATVRRFRKLRAIDARLDDLEDALFSLTLAGSDVSKNRKDGPARPQ